MASRVRPLKRRPLEHSPRHLATTMPFCRSASCSERFRPVSTSAAGPSIAAGRKALARRSAGGVRGSSSIPIVSGELLRNVSAFPADAVERKIKISLIEFNSRLVAARGHNHRQHRKNVDIGRGTPGARRVARTADRTARISGVPCGSRRCACGATDSERRRQARPRRACSLECRERGARGIHAAIGPVACWASTGGGLRIYLPYLFLYHSKSSVVSGKTPPPPTPTATSEVNRTRPLYTLKIVDHHVDHYPLGQAGSGWRRALSSTFVKTVFDVSLKPCIRKAPRREGSVNRTCTMSNR